GPKQAQAIRKERAKKEFSSFQDFCTRVKIDRKLLAKLVLVGCFDSLAEKKEKLFSHLSFQPPENGTYLPSRSLHEKIALEMSILGFSLSAHPITLFRNVFEEHERVKSSELAHFCEHEKVKVAGVKVILHTPPTKSGKRVIFVTMEDEDGLIDTVIFPAVQESYAKVIYEADFLLLEGHIKKYGRATSIVVEKAYDLQEML
ncbi:hypothetical protein IBX65_08835, partial [Candidatus Aerophobetes bacterium]|nr:hypothetical protein [Candidatus Aerophobetes bacterium]